MKKPKRRPSDRDRLNFILERSAHYFCRDAEDLICVSSREEIDAAMKAEKRGPLTGRGEKG